MKNSGSLAFHPECKSRKLTNFQKKKKNGSGDLCFWRIISPNDLTRRDSLPVFKCVKLLQNTVDTHSVPGISV